MKNVENFITSVITTVLCMGVVTPVYVLFDWIYDYTVDFGGIDRVLLSGLAFIVFISALVSEEVE